MTHAQAKSELEAIYMSLSEEKKKAIDVAIEALEQEPSGDLISRQAVQNYIAHFLSLYLQDNVREAVEAIDEVIGDLPSIDIPQNNNGCENCRWQSKSESEMPCQQCMHNYTDEWEMEKPTDTITMTREEFSEKLMEHYRQGRADEKAYQNGEIMQFFSPD